MDCAITKRFFISSPAYRSTVLLAHVTFIHSLGIRKFENFQLMLNKDDLHSGNYDYIFVGDTGEKDEDAGHASTRSHHHPYSNLLTY